MAKRKHVGPIRKDRQIGISTLTPKQQAQADEQDALMDTLKVLEDWDSVEPEPDHYQDELTRARELLRESGHILTTAAKLVRFNPATPSDTAIWDAFAARIEKELEGEE
jgi:hypothetical protein